MTFILQNVSDILDWQEFSSKGEAHDWLQDNILASDLDDWALIDPRGQVLMHQ